MVNLPISKVFSFDDIYYKFVINKFEKQAFFKLEDVFFLSTIYADFENWLKKFEKK